jgi:hypothetical protein
MQFPETVEEFMEKYKIVDTEQIYTNGIELVPIFRMQQWFDHLSTTDTQPVVRGKWGLDPQCPICGEDRYKGLDADIWDCWEPPFCPNCGAMMDEY